MLPALPAARAAEPADLWKLALDKQPIHRFSTLITASQVRDRLATDAGIDAAIEWCKATGVTKVYIKNFNDRPVTAKLDGQALELEPRGWICRWK